MTPPVQGPGGQSHKLTLKENQTLAEALKDKYGIDLGSARPPASNTSVWTAINGVMERHPEQTIFTTRIGKEGKGSATIYEKTKVRQINLTDQDLADLRKAAAVAEEEAKAKPTAEAKPVPEAKADPKPAPAGTTEAKADSKEDPKTADSDICRKLGFRQEMLISRKAAHTRTSAPLEVKASDISEGTFLNADFLKHPECIKEEEGLPFFDELKALKAANSKQTPDAKVVAKKSNPKSTKGFPFSEDFGQESILKKVEGALLSAGAVVGGSIAKVAKDGAEIVEKKAKAVGENIQHRKEVRASEEAQASANKQAIKARKAMKEAQAALEKANTETEKAVQAAPQSSDETTALKAAEELLKKASTETGSALKQMGPDTEGSETASSSNYNKSPIN